MSNPKTINDVLAMVPEYDGYEPLDMVIHPYAFQGTNTCFEAKSHSWERLLKRADTEAAARILLSKALDEADDALKKLSATARMLYSDPSDSNIRAYGMGDSRAARALMDIRNTRATLAEICPDLPTVKGGVE